MLDSASDDKVYSYDCSISTENFTEEYDLLLSLCLAVEQ